MNNLLEIKLKFRPGKRAFLGSSSNLRANGETTVEKIDKLIGDIRRIEKYYSDKNTFVEGYLIDVNYNDIIAKSRRIRELYKPAGKSSNDIVVGARFSDAPEGQENHIITYYVDKQTLEKTIEKLKEAKEFLKDNLQGKATPDNFNETKDKTPDLKYDGYSSKNCVRGVIVDCSVVESFSVPNVTASDYKESFLLTFFETEQSVSDLLDKIGIDQYKFRYAFYGKDTIVATWDLYQLLVERIPFLISMISADISKISVESFKNDIPRVERFIPAPNNEPIIGVIDNLFDEKVYFSDWVENVDYLDEFENIEGKEVDRNHGTEVTSIVVDGPALNPWLDDGCGRFRVRHFGVCVDHISVPRLVKKVIDIVNNNPDIHVWNLSLGTDDEVSKNFISYDASIIDELQFKKNIIFVVSGTNDNREEKIGNLRVGSPADSLNSIVVNSVRRNGLPASYTREGKVLSFFNKPDIAYYGGDFEEKERINACASYDIEGVYGTSFAAPWIARKLSFLIDIMGFPREVAKALIIDAAAGWEYKQSTYKIQNKVGYGVVPIKISDILLTKNDEIKFILFGTSDSYSTSNHSIPVPRDTDGKYPFITRAALCYFPETSRSQGVDYTNRELSIKFGRVKRDGSIEDINENVQDEIGHYTDERQSRRDFRKWENTKFISKILRNNRSLNSYEERQWGISITSKERLDSKMKKGINFGVVITLKEINRINRINDFISACSLRGWIVNEINIDERLDLYHSNQEEVKFE